MKMGIFESQTLVNGKVISGRIKDRIFYMNGINPTNKIKPFIMEIGFNKEWLDLTIKELEEIKEKL